MVVTTLVVDWTSGPPTTWREDSLCGTLIQTAWKRGQWIPVFLCRWCTTRNTDDWAQALGQANWGWCQGFPAISMGRKRQSKFQLSPLGLKEWRHFPHIATWWLVTWFIPLSHANNLMYSCSHADLSHTYLISVQVYIYIHIIYTVYIYINFAAVNLYTYGNNENEKMWPFRTTELCV